MEVRTFRLDLTTSKDSSSVKVRTGFRFGSASGGQTWW